jgi:hypothetical protein
MNKYKEGKYNKLIELGKFDDEKIDNIIDSMIKSSIKSDTEKNRQTDVDYDFIKDLFKNNSSCIYCNCKWSTGDKRPTLERIDNDLGHLKNNCVLACYNCNITRQDKYTFSEFKEFTNNQTDTEDDRQNIYLYEGLPLIARKSRKDKKIVNSDYYIVESFNNNKVVISCIEQVLNEEKEKITLDISKQTDINLLLDLFLVRYCMTTHKAQGETIPDKYTIHEFNKMSQELKFTAATRTTNYKNVFISL